AVHAVTTLDYGARRGSRYDNSRPEPVASSPEASKGVRMPDHDLVIRGATVIDGTGVDGRAADVACRAGLISAIGEVTGEVTGGTEEIDGRGRCLAPGFIDPHTH